MKIAFYAPMNDPDEGPPSGDRLIGRQLVEGLTALGHEVEVATRLKTWSRDPGALQGLRDEAAHEVMRLHGAPFDAWVTYHVYYKAPDLIGPWIARARSIPYFIVEGSLAPSRAEGPWAEHYGLAREAMDLASQIFCISRRDRPMLEELGFGRKLTDLDPWVDAKRWGRPPQNTEEETSDGPLKLVTAAMMRNGDKLASYGLVAGALLRLNGDWQLSIYGDGPARAEVEELFEPAGDQVRFEGLADPATLTEAYTRSDLFVWPGIGEGFGMTYLEALAAGLPCVACNEPGPQAALTDAAARLTQTTASAFAWAINDLGRDQKRRETMSAAARRLAQTRFSKDRFLHALNVGLNSCPP